MFIKKTVDGVLAGFRRTVEDLRTIASQQNDTADNLNQDAHKLLGQAGVAREEAARAQIIADRVEKLIS